ncbi:hypothetical protein G6F22_016472 [Rhizopus arrhizus]|nr:hypothetical protein G6F22_016472 [Rhizopus arrhizus]
MSSTRDAAVVGDVVVAADRAAVGDFLAVDLQFQREVRTSVEEVVKLVAQSGRVAIAAVIVDQVADDFDLLLKQGVLAIAQSGWRASATASGAANGGGERRASVFADLKHITHAAHGVHQLSLERVVDLAAQPSHRDFDHIGVAVEIDVPHLFCQFQARQDFALFAHQQHQQGEFFGGQVQAHAIAAGAAAQQVQLQPVDSQQVLAAGLHSAKGLTR